MKRQRRRIVRQTALRIGLWLLPVPVMPATGAEIDWRDGDSALRRVDEDGWRQARELSQPFHADADASASASVSPAATQGRGRTDAHGDSPSAGAPEGAAAYAAERETDKLAPTVAEGDGQANANANAHSADQGVGVGPWAERDAAPAFGRPRLARPQRPSADAQRLISVDFERAEMKVVLRAFARFTGLNVIANDAVKGEVTVRLDNVPWRQAFEVLLDAHGLAMQQRGDVIWVAPTADMMKRVRERDDARARRAETEPLASRLFALHYQRADDMHRLLSGSGTQRLLSKRGAASADIRSNRLFVTDVPARLDQIEQMIRSFDRPARQVMIEARIVEADEGFSRNLGFRLGLTGGAPTDRIAAPNGTFFDLPAGPLNGMGAATAALSLFRVGADRLITLELSALEAEGRGKVLSSPRVVTTDRGKATIEQGTELPYQAKVRSGVSGLQFRRAGLRLEVTPHITPDHRVSLDVDVSKDTVGMETAAGPAIDTKQVKTQVEVDNGGTVAIGGIFAHSERRDVIGVPGLHRLPWIGALFRRTAISERKTELIVFITPTVVDAGEPFDAVAAAASATQRR